MYVEFLEWSGHSAIQWKYFLEKKQTKNIHVKEVILGYDQYTFYALLGRIVFEGVPKIV